MLKLIIITIFLLTSCTDEASLKVNANLHENHQDSSRTIHLDTIANDVILFQRIKSSADSRKYMEDSVWKNFESMGEPDTALLLFAYRKALSIDTTFGQDLESFIRLYKEDKKVKKMLPKLFKIDTTIQTKLKNIDTLNKRFLTYAKKDMAAEVEEYGQADKDGILFEFLSGMKRKK